jgi:hypothetical protein
LKEREVGLDRQQMDLEHQAAEGDQTTHTVALSLAELQQRREKLTEDMQALEKLPPLGRTLHYRTPVSQPVHADEFLFECRAGRVTFVDMTSLVEEIRQSLEEKKQELRTHWEVSDTTPPVGAFRLRYVLERERGPLEGALPDAPPPQDESFNLGLSGWVVEPVVQVRGETLEQALAPGSDFRQVVDRIDPQMGVVTFWVYPESFGLFRQLRDYLYERDLVVAGRPLPDGFPMTFSRNGSVSRGQ